MINPNEIRDKVCPKCRKIFHDDSTKNRRKLCISCLGLKSAKRNPYNSKQWGDPNDPRRHKICAYDPCNKPFVDRSRNGLISYCCKQHALLQHLANLKVKRSKSRKKIADEPRKEIVDTRLRYVQKIHQEDRVKVCSVGFHEFLDETPNNTMKYCREHQREGAARDKRIAELEKDYDLSSLSEALINILAMDVSTLGPGGLDAREHALFHCKKKHT